MQYSLNNLIQTPYLQALFKLFKKVSICLKTLITIRQILGTRFLEIFGSSLSEKFQMKSIAPPKQFTI